MDHGQLGLALAAFADLFAGEFGAVDVLDRLCAAVPRVIGVLGAAAAVADGSVPGGGVIPAGGMASAGVSDGALVAGLLVVASSQELRAVEQSQHLSGAGPTVEALAGDGPVQWALRPASAARAELVAGADRLGVRSIAAVPLVTADRRWGVLTIYSGRDRTLDTEELDAARVLADVAAAYLGTARERALQRADHTRLQAQAVRDPLTGLANRVLLAERLNTALQALEGRPASVGLLFIDLDRFKEVNDAWGHEVGDRLLVALARRLEAALRPGDTLCRFGGDEFVVVCEELDPVTGALVPVGQRILDLLDEPLALPEGPFVVRASIGGVLAEAGDTVEAVLRHADLAAYVAKREGGGSLCVSDRTTDGHINDVLRTEGELEGALERGELVLHVQPIVTLGGGARRGAEVLLCWQHPRRGLLDAGAFLPVLERTGLMAPVGRWVLGEVLRDLRRFCPDGAVEDWFVALNVTAGQLRDPGLVDHVASLLATSGTEPGRVMVEVSESALTERRDAVTTALGALADLGVRVGVDDFGTASSSLASLAQLPATAIKIDRSLVARLGRGGCATRRWSGARWPLPTSWACWWWPGASRPSSSTTCWRLPGAMRARASSTGRRAPCPGGPAVLLCRAPRTDSPMVHRRVTPRWRPCPSRPTPSWRCRTP